MSGTANNNSRPTNPWAVLAVLCVGFFLIMLDTTIVNVALPQLALSLHSSLDHVVWVVNAYLLTYSVLLIPSGRLGDIWGPRNLFTAGVALFTLASAACGLSQTSDELIAMRLIQGAAAALLTPQALTMITMTFPPARRGTAMGVWGGVVGLAILAGPPLGGLLVEYAGWRWIFFVNVPIGVVAIVGAARFLPDPRVGRKRRLDLVGVALSAAGSFCMVFALLEGERYSWGRIWGPITIKGMLGVSIVSIVGLLLWERVAHEPLFPPGLFRTRGFSLMVWIQFLLAFGMLALYLPVVLGLQSALGMSTLRTGLILVPMALAGAIAAPISGRLADKVGGKYLLAAGLTLFAVGMALIWAALSPAAGWISFMLPMIVTGAGVGLANAPLTSEAMRSVAPQETGAASGVLNSARQFGGLLGVTVVGGAALQSHLQSALNHRAQSTATSLNAPPIVRTQFVHAFSGVDRTGLLVAPGQNGGVRLPTGLSAHTTEALQQAAHEVFTRSLVDAAGPTMLIPIVVVAIGAICSLFADNPGRSTAPGLTKQLVGDGAVL